MVHGPCGPNDPCHSRPKSNGGCAFRYPQRPQQFTHFQDGFLNLRRRCLNSFTKMHKGQQVQITDVNVAPYNPALSLRYNCHVNVAICTSALAVKYLYKYVLKGVCFIFLFFFSFLFFFLIFSNLSLLLLLYKPLLLLFYFY